MGIGRQQAEQTMKMLRFLLFALAISPFAVGAAAAAERHVKANPADRAKNCNIYGAGFVYVPGADLCMKIGGWARAQASGGSGRVNWGALNSAPNDRGGNTTVGARGYVTTDVREQTGYGTVRAYLSVGADHQ
jgi:hypothetical protein